MINGKPPTSWNELNKRHRLEAIHSEKEYDAARVVIERLAILQNPTSDQAAYLETLSVLMEAYEQQKYPIRRLSGLAALRALMAQNAMTASDLGRLLGNRSLGAKILHRERELSKAHIITLSEHFKVNPGLFFSTEKPGPSLKGGTRANLRQRKRGLSVAGRA